MEQSVGKTLREARAQRGVTLAEVEARTRIRVRFLRAIEEEDWGVLPGEAYARGFIRTYAGYLGLDGGLLAEQHRREIGADRPGEGAPGSRSDPAAGRGTALAAAATDVLQGAGAARFGRAGGGAARRRAFE